MDPQGTHSLLMFVIALPCMLYAARSDLRCRLVPDLPWQAIGVSGAVLYFIRCVWEKGILWEHGAVSASMLCAIAAATWGNSRQDAVLAIASAALAATAFLGGNGGRLAEAGIIAVTFCLIYYIMYVVDILRGGADAKCLMALTVAFPLYPSFLGLPLWGEGGAPSGALVFSAAVLFCAGIATVAFGAAYFLWKKPPEGTKRSLSGFRIPLADAESGLVWPMEDVVDGEVVRIGPEDHEASEIYARLRAVGRTDVLVTPMIPFIVPLAASFVVVTVIGDPFSLLFRRSAYDVEPVLAVGAAVTVQAGGVD